MADGVVSATGGVLPADVILIDVTSINDTTDTLTANAHGRSTGDGCTLPAVNGLLANTIYYLRRVNANALTLHLTRADALANANKVPITGTMLFTLMVQRTVFRGLMPEDFVWDGSNLSATLEVAPLNNVASTTGSATLTYNGHGRWTGEGCIRVAGGMGGGGLATNTAYYLRRLSVNTFTLHPTCGDALSGSNPITITSTGTFSIMVLRDPRQGIYVIEPNSALDGANGANVRQIAGWVSPRMFGAGPAASDQSAPIMAALNFARYSFNSSRGAHDLSCDFESQIYRVTRSINLTGLNNPYFHLHNGGLHSTAAGKIALDMTGQNSAHLNDFTIIGQEATPGNEATAPAVGLFYGRDVNESPAPNMRMEDVTITGKFSKACVINLASEVSSEISCIYNNEHRASEDDAAAYAAAYVDNPDSIEDKMGGALTSEYADLPAPNLPTPWIASNLSHYVSQANYRRRADVTLAIIDISRAAIPVASFNASSLTAAVT